MPPNPYHTSNSIILVSAQDSELQSLSSDVQFDEDEKLIKSIKHKK